MKNLLMLFLLVGSMALVSCAHHGKKADCCKEKDKQACCKDKDKKCKDGKCDKKKACTKEKCTKKDHKDCGPAKCCDSTCEHGAKDA